MKQERTYRLQQACASALLAPMGAVVRTSAKQTCRARRLGAVVLAICASICPGLLAAEEPTVDSLFGRKIRTAVESRDPGDDVALAEEMIETAMRNRPTRPRLFQSLCLKSHEISARVAGGDEMAVRALTTLISHTHDARRREQHVEKLVGAYQAQLKRSDASSRRSTGQATIEAILYLASLQAQREDYTSAAKQATVAQLIATKVVPDYAGETRAWMRHYGDLSNIARQCSELQMKLVMAPRSTATRNALVKLLVVQKDQPVEAVKLLTDAVEETWGNNVRLAACDPKELSARQCFRLGQWYLTLAAKAGRVGTLKTLSRAKMYLGVVLSRSDSPDMLKLKARMDIKRVAQGIEAAQAGILHTASLPKVVIVSRASFQKLYEARFPGKNNVARSGSVKVLGPHAGSPKGILAGDSPCVLKKGSGTFVFQWYPPISGRFLVLVGDSGDEDAGAWHDATMRVAGNSSVSIPGFGADKVLIADFGKTRWFSSLRIDVKRSRSPGLAGLEIHPSRPR